MPNIEITEECRALIAAEFPFGSDGACQKGNWQMPVDVEAAAKGAAARRVNLGLRHSRRHHHLAPAWLAVGTATLLCMYA